MARRVCWNTAITLEEWWPLLALLEVESRYRDITYANGLEIGSWRVASRTGTEFCDDEWRELPDPVEVLTGLGCRRGMRRRCRRLRYRSLAAVRSGRLWEPWGALATSLWVSPMSSGDVFGVVLSLRSLCCLRQDLDPRAIVSFSVVFPSSGGGDGA